MAHLYISDLFEVKYIDKKLQISPEEYHKKLENSTTVYVGNLSIYTTESQIDVLFSQAGLIKDIKLGINRNSGQPIGFCFVIYQTHEGARQAVQFLNRKKLDNRIIRVDWDYGFEEGRQFGRGKGGLQKREEYRSYEDKDRPQLVKKMKVEDAPKRGYEKLL